MDRKRPSDAFTRLHQHITSTIFLSLFSCLLVYTHSTILMDARQWALTFSLLCFLGPLFLIAFVPVNTFIIIIVAILIVITPNFYLLLCHEPIWNMHQQGRAFTHYLVTHVLCFKTVRDVFQQPPRVYLKGLDTNFLCFKTVGNKKITAGLMRIIYIIYYYKF